MFQFRICIPFVIFICSFHNLVGECEAFELFSFDCLVAQNTCPDSNINFFLYTSERPLSPVMLSVNNISTLINAPFMEGEIKFLIHGYTGNQSYSPNMELRPAYFQREVPVNIISVDYGPLVKDGCYMQSVQNTGVVAMCIAQFIKNLLHARSDIITSQFHVIGFSLGAQVASQIQSHLNGTQIERLTVLDAAFPLFHEPLISVQNRISKGDAKFVDAIHTNAGIKGVLNTVADIDFYANGGILQPGCGTNASCSHVRSVELYAASINPKNRFVAYRRSFIDYFFGWYPNKNDFQLYGEYVNHMAKGVYLFDTSDRPPYVLIESKRQN